MSEFKKDNSPLAGKGEGGEWKTINGAHIFIEDGQSMEDAMAEKFDKRKPEVKKTEQPRTKQVVSDAQYTKGPTHYTGDHKRFNNIRNMMDYNTSRERMEDELDMIGFNKDGISHFFNLTGNSESKVSQLMSMFNKPNYRK